MVAGSSRVQAVRAPEGLGEMLVDAARLQAPGTRGAEQPLGHDGVSSDRRYGHDTITYHFGAERTLILPLRSHSD